MVEKKVTAMDADKVIYFWQPLERYEKQKKVDKKIEMLGLQGATSTANTKTVQTTQTKTAAIKTVGQTTQQRVVAVIFNGSDDLEKDLYREWADGHEIGLWRVDFNDVKGEKPSRTVRAEFTRCLLPQNPSTEALNGVVQTNLTFEVQGEARVLDENNDYYRLNEDDFQEPKVFDSALRFFYEFSHGMKPTDKKEAKIDEGTIDEGVVE